MAILAKRGKGMYARGKRLEDQEDDNGRHLSTGNLDEDGEAEPVTLSLPGDATGVRDDDSDHCDGCEAACGEWVVLRLDSSSCCQ